MLKISPSIIAGDQSRLGEEVRAIDEAGADMVHLDVMDGHFVPNITMGPGIIKDLRKVTYLPFDCHLMIAEPWKYIEDFVKAGVDRISFHVENERVGETLAKIRDAGKTPGLAINPDSPAEALEEFIDRIDFIVVMTVHPGFYGQSFIRSALDKVPVLRDISAARGLFPAIQVDGGVDTGNVGIIEEAGAHEVVAGSAVHKSADYRAAIATLKAGKAQ